jgi:hypothetical protein
VFTIRGLGVDQRVCGRVGYVGYVLVVEDSDIGSYDRLRELCLEYGLVAIRNDNAGKWELGALAPGSDWEYVRVAQVSDMDMFYTPWRLVEKRIVTSILDRSFNGHG